MNHQRLLQFFRFDTVFYVDCLSSDQSNWSFLILPGAEVMNNLIHNQGRLVTVLDLHYLLMYIAIPRESRGSVKQEGIISRISDKRTCTDLPLYQPNICICLDNGLSSFLYFNTRHCVLQIREHHILITSAYCSFCSSVVLIVIRSILVIIC